MQNRTTCRTRPAGGNLLRRTALCCPHFMEVGSGECNIRRASELLSPRNYLGNPERWSIAFQPEEETETAMLNTIMGTNPIHSFSALDWLPECNSHSCKIRRQVVDIGLLIARLVSSLGRVFSVTWKLPRWRPSCVIGSRVATCTRNQRRLASIWPVIWTPTMLPG